MLFYFKQLFYIELTLNCILLPKLLFKMDFS